MSAEQQIARLESLLERIRTKADQPRPVAAVVAVASPVVDEEPFEPAPPVVDSAPFVDEAPIEDLDLDLADDIVELSDDEATELEPPEEASPAELGVEFDSGDEEVAPESAPRPATIAEALDEVAEAFDEVNTPPPESGPQAVQPESQFPPGAEALEAELEGAEDIDELLEADLSGRPITQPPEAGGPTMEQLGQTVDLEGADSPNADLELERPATEIPSSSMDDLEVSLAPQGFAGGYDASLEPPPEARAELEAHARSQHDPVERLPAPVADAPPAGEAEVTERQAAPAVQPAEFVAAAPTESPRTFGALLDASLGL